MAGKYYDHASKNSSKHLLELNADQLTKVISTQLSNAAFLDQPLNLPVLQLNKHDRIYHSNNGVWEAIILEKLRRTDVNILLDSFFIFEWFPRSPGLFYTREGRMAREEASSNIETLDQGVVIYNHHGKQSMLDGGIGNIRLKPIKLEKGNFYFVSASSDGECHEGFPVAIPESLYNTIIEEIVERGTVVRNLIGKLQLVPHSLLELYNGYKDVPKCYLEIIEISSAQHPKSLAMEELNVSVAVSFKSNFEGYNRIYASYVSFDPSNKKSFEERINWLEQDYVIEKYKGEVITDFDEITNHFANAKFSLNKVMNLRIEKNGIDELRNQLHITASDVLKLQSDISDYRKSVSQMNENAVDVGIITILPEELSAVVEHFKRNKSYSKKVGEQNARTFHLGEINPKKENQLKVAVIQTLDQGNRSVMSAYNTLSEEFKPSLIILFGIAGGIHKSLKLDDVVIADSVYYYDKRAVEEKETLRRIEPSKINGWTKQLLNNYLASFKRSDPEFLASMGSYEKKFNLHVGPIGSGEAVIKFNNSSERAWLSYVNDKTLAVETEAGGAMQQLYEDELSRNRQAKGLLVIRGISDHADMEKNDKWRLPATKNAMKVLVDLLKSNWKEIKST